MTFQASRHACPIGTLLLVFDGETLLGLDFDEAPLRLRRLLQRCHGAHDLVPAATPPAIGDRLDAYFAGQTCDIDSITIRISGTALQASVWSALRGIAPGNRESYGTLAARLGRPTASRAIGHANASNPISIVIPCHRLVGRTGALVGYAGGVARKAWLLAHEARHGPGC